MTTRMVLTLGASALLLGGSMVGCAAGGGDALASASSRDETAQARTASLSAAAAGGALAKHQTDRAIAAAEAAVALVPHNADYRVLLGQSYLQGGRFVSAKQAFADALALAPGNGKAALNYALAQVATGDAQGARKTLDAHNDSIAPADRGLALALAGDPADAVTLLTEVARSAQSSPTVRQNLALSLAMAGQWQAARVVASADMSPADVDARLEQWAAFAQPQSSSDQVASLLGVHPVEDGGQPVALALNAAVTPIRVAAESAPAPAAEAVVEDKAPAAVVVQDVPPPTRLNAVPKIIFAARHEVVQPLPIEALRVQSRQVAAIRAGLIRAATGPTKVALSRPAPRAPVPGTWFVQLGAYDSPGVAKDAWNRAQHRLPALAGRGPSGAAFSTKTGNFYRLSVGGFARADANSLCMSYRHVGGQCFVRGGAGDQTAQWVQKPGMQKPGVQIASR